MKNVDTITSKETYLQWRAEWRADYKALSQRIRDLKSVRHFQDLCRGGWKPPQEDLDKHNAKVKRLAITYLPYAIREAKAQATAMLEARKASKAIAQRCYAQEHAAAAVPA